MMGAGGQDLWVSGSPLPDPCPTWWASCKKWAWEKLVHGLRGMQHTQKPVWALRRWGHGKGQPAAGGMGREGGRRDTLRGLLVEPSACTRMESCWYPAANAECVVQEASSPCPPGEIVSSGSQTSGSGMFLEPGQLSGQGWPSPNHLGHSGQSPPLAGLPCSFPMAFLPCDPLARAWDMPGG